MSFLGKTKSATNQKDLGPAGTPTTTGRKDNFSTLDSFLVGSGGALINSGANIYMQQISQDFQEYLATNNINFAMQQLEANGVNPLLAVTNGVSTPSATYQSQQQHYLAKALLLQRAKNSGR